MTVEELAREVVGSLDAEQGYLICQKWITNRYQEIAALLPLKTLLKFGEVVIPGAYRTGTITATRGSDAIVGVGTSWTTALNGRFLRRERNWYEIEAVANATHLTLISPYTETTATGAGYYIVQRRVPLIPGVRKMQEMRVARNTRPLDLVGAAEMDIAYADRGLISAAPLMAAEVGIDTTVSPTVRLFEFYPYPLDSCHVSFTYHENPAPLSMSYNLPEFIDPGVLKEGVMIDLFRFEMGRALKEGRSDIAGYWRNEHRAQETTWQRRLADVVVSNAATDAGTLMLRRERGSRGDC